MGRKRRKDKHLPQRMYMRRGAYYFVNRDGRWIPLGRDYAMAMAEYGRISGPNSPCITMRDVIDRYRILVLPHKAESSQYRENTQLTRLASVFGALRPDEISAQHVYKYMDARLDFPTAARHEVTLLHHVFKKAIRWGAGTTNPAHGIEKPKSNPRTRYITDDEFEAVCELAIPSMKVAMNFALLTGLRRGDILNLTRDNLTDEGLFVSTSKTGKGLLFEYSDALMSAIKCSRALKPQVPGFYLVRTRSGGGYSTSGFSANWQRLMTKAVGKGVKHFTFNDIRAKCASDSASLQEASDRLGHASTAITKSVYYRKPMKVKPVK